MLKKILEGHLKNCNVAFHADTCKKKKTHNLIKLGHVYFCATHWMPRHDSDGDYAGSGTSRKRSRTDYDDEDDIDHGNNKPKVVLLYCSIAPSCSIAPLLLYCSICNTDSLHRNKTSRNISLGLLTVVSSTWRHGKQDMTWDCNQLNFVLGHMDLSMP